ncbi:hypothetical protein HY634_04635 [Candidatus Uhrbacteria bacterium]|nr:hypothetical protein [Candidatus Uhrbacteria bacterium]
MFNPLHWLRGTGSGTAPKKDTGLNEEHLQLRRAIERCDSFKFAVDAKQMTVAEVADKLLSNDFPKSIVRKAIAETFGDAAAGRYV